MGLIQGSAEVSAFFVPGAEGRGAERNVGNERVGLERLSAVVPRLENTWHGEVYACLIRRLHRALLA